jgi:hypothetical protein
MENAIRRVQAAAEAHFTGEIAEVVARSEALLAAASGPGEPATTRSKVPHGA